MNKEGLTLHYYENKKNLVIFIHGLFGSNNTWQNKSKEYLTDLLYERREIKGNFDLGNFNYESTLKPGINFLKKHQLTINDLSRVLKTEIQAYEKIYDNIILIGHSMGGLIAKQYLLNNLNNNKVKLYISIATPHLGSDLASFIKYYKHPQIVDLIENKDYLVNLNREWKNNKTKLPESYYLYGVKDNIVKRASAIPDRDINEKYIREFIENHTSIVKLTHESTIFKHLIQILDDFYLKNNPEKIILLNNSKKTFNSKDSFNEYIDNGYQIVETLMEKEKNEIFNVMGMITTNLKDKEKFESYLNKFPKEIEIYLKSTSKLIYTGIPLIPLTFFEGYLLRLITNRKYLVNYRNHETMGYEELKHGNKDIIKYEKTDINLVPENCTEVSINLSSSFGINNERIEASKKGFILTYRREQIEVDHITHYSEVEKIADEFLIYIRKLKEEKNIKRINIFAGIPVPMAYEIARKIENHDPEIYVYHYENNKYEWGINIKTGELEIL